jgi:protein-L-isoaspartate(D-aspartate) O-methyltransferase
MKHDYKAQRQEMVERQILARGVVDPGVLAAMGKVPRHLFVPEEERAFAYADEPLPIGEGQTISQPYIVAYMTELLGPVGNARVLEVGTGSGYQTAVLAELAREVYSVEVIRTLSERARQTLESLGYRNVNFTVGDGARGWPEMAPFDGIIVTAAAGRIPTALEGQLAEPGVLVVPVGTDIQDLIRVRRDEKGFTREKLIPVRFVPLVRSA